MNDTDDNSKMTGNSDSDMKGNMGNTSGTNQSDGGKMGGSDDDMGQDDDET